MRKKLKLKLKEYLRGKFLHWLVKDLFNALEPEDVLEFTEKGIEYKGKELTNEQVDRMSEDAERFGESAIWKLLSEDAKYHANELMYEKSETFEDMRFGKAMLYAISDVEERIGQLSKLKNQ